MKLTIAQMWRCFLKGENPFETYRPQQHPKLKGRMNRIRGPKRKARL